MSCSTPEKKPSANPVLYHTNAGLNEEYIGGGGAIIAYNNGIIGIEESGPLPPFFLLSTNGKTPTYMHFGNRGQGPEEFIHPYPIQYLDENTFGVYDLMLKMYKEVTVPTEAAPSRTTGQITLESRPFSAIKTAYNQYAGLSTKEGLFVLTDSTGKEIHTFFEYPYRNNDEHAVKNHLRGMAYQGTIAANPQKTKCVYASLAGEIIHFYDIRKDDILLISKTEKTYPLYKPEDKGTSYASMLDWENTVGYISVAATEQFVYALYCGKTYKELRGDAGLVFAAEELRIFDWTGTMVKTRTLDAPCRYICATHDDSRLWAMAYLPEITPVYFDLNETPANNTAYTVNDGIMTKKTDIVNSTVKELDKSVASVTSVMKHDSLRINQLTIGKIKPGETKKFTMPLQLRITSFRTTSDDIILRDSISPANQSWIQISLTKQKTGVFNDTIYLSSDNRNILIVVSGEVAIN
jgi:hypothetical protein